MPWDGAAPRAPASHSHAALSVAETFFFEELAANAGYAEAAHWLRTERTRSVRSGAMSSAMSSTMSSTSCSSVSSPVCSPRRPNGACLSGALSIPGTTRMASDMSELALGLGEDGGLLYTDAAHKVLEGPPQSPCHYPGPAQQKPNKWGSIL